ncbi:hypothetical protein [Methylovirgula sp. HY1]|uniref:hypothetical protein n=1 Tax=Methylovirgula sp. HY1 TaxID=2822761 RepID=UPI001C5B06F4
MSSPHGTVPAEWADFRGSAEKRSLKNTTTFSAPRFLFSFRTPHDGSAKGNRKPVDKFSAPTMAEYFDAAVINAGQAGPALVHWLRRDQENPGRGHFRDARRRSRALHHRDHICRCALHGAARAVQIHPTVLELIPTILGELKKA